MSNEKTVKSPYRIKRYWFFLLVTVVSLVLPWITIDGNHIFLLSFDQKQLHLAGIAFDMQELYLMPFLLMLLFIGIFFITTLGGRVWCGWSCPQTIFRVIYRDLFETKLLGLRKRIANKQIEPDMSKPVNQLKKLVAILLWSVLALVAASNFMWYFVPPEDFFSYLSNPSEHMVLVGFVLGIAAFLIFDVVFIKENFCVYICPYSRVQSVLFDKETLLTVYDPNRGGKIYDHETKLYNSQKDLLAVEPEAECTACESCVKVCPTHIDIRKGLQLECINCLECADACTKVMGKLGKESLIHWSSEKEVVEKGGKTNLFRGKIIAYAVVLGIITVALFAMGSTKEHMLLNINKTTRLYKIQNDGSVENAYLFLIQNTDSKDHEYTFELDNPDLEIVKPTKPVLIKAGQKSKEIVIVRAKEVLVQDERKDTPLPLKVKAYSINEPERVFVYRDSTFIYPRYDIYLNKINE
jgi:cytochrome c oxidase accessory protein FixG